MLTVNKKDGQQAVAAGPVPPGAMPARPGVLDLSALNVLLIDGSRFMNSLVISVLKALNVGRVSVATDGAQAIEILETSLIMAKAGMRFEIDILVLERSLPVRDGDAVLRWVRTHRDDVIRFLPIIMTSGYATEAAVREARDLGATEFLVKPFSVKSLCDRILNIINNPRPFVKAPGFFGPDRRRKVEPLTGEERRNAGRAVRESREAP